MAEDNDAYRTLSAMEDRGLRFGAALRTSARIGGWVEAGTPLAVDAFASSGADWVAIDLQHGLETRGRLVESVRAADAWDTPSLVRVSSATPESIGSALDSGAAGVIVPTVEDAAAAAEIVRASRFPPAGARSWGPIASIVRERGLTPRAINAATLVFVMIETQLGYERREEILSTAGLNGVFIGPTDLSISMTGELATWPLHSDVEAAVHAILATATERGLIAGYSCASADIARQRAREGFTLLPVSTDLSLMKHAWRGTLAAARGQAASAAASSGSYGA